MQITKHTQTNIQWLLVVFLLLNSAVMFFGATDSIYSLLKPNIIVGYVAIFVCWKIVSGTSERFPLEIVDKPTQLKFQLVPSNFTNVFKDKTVARFNYVSSILSVAFVLNMFIFLGVASRNAEKKVTIFFNNFGEFQIELILFGAIGSFIIMTAIVNIISIRKKKAIK